MVRTEVISQVSLDNSDDAPPAMASGCQYLVDDVRLAEVDDRRKRACPAGALELTLDLCANDG